MRNRKADRRLQVLNRPTTRAKAIAVNWNALMYFIGCVLISLAIIQLMGCGLTSQGSDETENTLSTSAPGTSENTVGAMAVGDTHVLNFNNGVANIAFEDGAEAGHYVLALTGGMSGTTISITQGNAAQTTAMTTTTEAPRTAAVTDGPSGNPAHDWFRAEEQRMNEMPPAAVSPNPANYLGLGSTESFRVLTGSSASFVTITATMIGSGGDINLFMDNSTTTPISDTQRAALTTTLNAICSRMTGAFGAPSDINGNGGVDVVLTKTLSNFGGGPLSGYFWSGDLMPAGQVPASNQREIIFLIAPDTNGFYGGTVPVEDVLERVLPGVFAHELQHLLNFMHKATPEDPTINEAISHAVENWSGYPHELRYKQADCLAHLASVNLGNSSIDIPERGCGALLLQHLCEQSGDVGSCLASMTTSSGAGWQTVAQSTGEDLGAAVAKMLAAIVVTGSNLDSTSGLKFRPESTGPAGDVTGFDPYGSYDDHRGTTMAGAAIDPSGLSLPYSKNTAGFGTLVEIQGQPSLHIEISGSGTSLYTYGGGGVLIRIADAGASSLSKAH